MSFYGWQEIIGVIGVFVLIIAVITMSIWQLGATLRAKAALRRDQDYRNLVEKAVQAQENSERQLAELNGQLAEVHQRMRKIEHILQQVE
jgi:biopolymer transport protein ExbB/TolQ